MTPFDFLPAARLRFEFIGGSWPPGCCPLGFMGPLLVDRVVAVGSELLMKMICAGFVVCIWVGEDELFSFIVTSVTGDGVFVLATQQVSVAPGAVGTIAAAAWGEGAALEDATGIRVVTRPATDLCGCCVVSKEPLGWAVVTRTGWWEEVVTGARKDDDKVVVGMLVINWDWFVDSVDALTEPFPGIRSVLPSSGPGTFVCVVVLELLSAKRTAMAMALQPTQMCIVRETSVIHRNMNMITNLAVMTTMSKTISACKNRGVHSALDWTIFTSCCLYNVFLWLVSLRRLPGVELGVAVWVDGSEFDCPCFELPERFRDDALSRRLRCSNSWMRVSRLSYQINKSYTYWYTRLKSSQSIPHKATSEF